MNLININKILDAKLIEEPWPHFIVDDVLNLDFSNLEFLYKDSIYYQIFGEFVNYKISILEKYRGDYSKSAMINNTQSLVRLFNLLPNKEIASHIDKKPKIWSMVLYLSPDTFGTGTILHNEKFFEHTQLIWKQNRALIFSVEPPGITSQYHGAVNKTNNPRLTMLFNIYDMTLQSNINDSSFFGDLKTFSSFMKIKQKK
tara:strand:- start:39 stop:638 length:600 start_codon:yes stop_codon:yes gene_type:complete